MNKRNGILTTLVIGSAAAIAGVFLYRRSGRNWQDDMQMARNWMDDRSEDMKDGIQYGKKQAQKALAKTEDASSEIMSRAKELGRNTAESVRETADKARANLS